MELDIGINYLKDPWGFTKLESWQKVDMLAYYYTQHGPSKRKTMLSTPFIYSNMLDEKLIDRGVDPNKASLKPSKPLPRLNPVKVHGGKSTPQLESMANIWATQNAQKHMKKKTGASDKAMNFWFNGD